MVKPPYFKNDEHDLRGQVDVGGELVGVPAQEQVAGVGVDRAQEALVAGVFQLVLHGVAGQRGVVGLDVQLEVVGQAVGAEEVDAGGGVEIVLVLGRLLGLGLDVELAGEADLLGVIDGHVHEAGQVVQLALHVGVPEGLVAFAAAPEHVARPAEFLGHFQGLLDLGGGKGEGVGVAACGRAVHVARIAEQVGRAPEQLDAGPLLLLLDDLDDGVEVLVGLGQRLALGGDVAVVEAEERGAELLHELEGHADPVRWRSRRESSPASQGRSIVPGPNGSPPVPRIVCQ